MVDNHLDFNDLCFSTKTDPTTVGFFKSIPLTDIKRFNEHIEKLTNNQREFLILLDVWFQSRRNEIIIVSGSPGSGKTFTVNETLMYIKADVLRMAYTARIACNIGGSTIHSKMQIAWEDASPLREIELNIGKLDSDEDEFCSKCLSLSENLQLSCQEYPDIVLIDEVGLISFWLIAQIIKYFFSMDKPILVILIGDKYQLKPVKCKLNIFDVKMFEYKLLELDENKRFSNEYKILIDNLKKIIDENDEKEFFFYVESNFPVLEDIDEFQLKKCQRVLVYRNETVKKYNAFYIENFPGKKIIIPKIHKGKILIKEHIILKNGCDVIVTSNCEVPNGTRLQFLKYDLNTDVLICKYPLSDKIVNIKRNKFTGQFSINLGFACTIHKFQGETINDQNVLMNFDKSSDIRLVYTAVSRVRSIHQILGILL